MTATTAVFGAVFTTVALFGGARALYGSSGGGAGWCHRFAVATIAAHFAVVDFAKATVMLAAVATPAQQLDVRSFVATPTRKGYNVIEFEVFGAATTLAHPAISGKNNTLGAFRYSTALGKAADLYQQQQQQKTQGFHAIRALRGLNVRFGAWGSGGFRTCPGRSAWSTKRSLRHKS